MQKILRPLIIVEILLFMVFFSFSFWLMIHTFSYKPERHAILISSRLWSDFAAHIPLIRSFSMGDNLSRMLRGLAPQYPIYPGEPIRYHFLFYMLVGILESMGLRIDWAINIPSALGFFGLLAGIYLLAKKLFHSRLTALLSILFFLFNGSLSFMKFFSTHPISIHTFRDIVHASAFPSFGPWDHGVITAFWNLNIYTNQRHLALAFAVVMFFMLWIVINEHKKFVDQWKSALVWGLAISVFPYFHQPTLLVFAVLLSAYIVLFPRLRLALLVTGGLGAILVVPQLLFMIQSGGAKSFGLYLGYLAHDNLTAASFINFWWQNLGLHSVLVPLGFFLIPRQAKKILFPIVPIFIMANVWKFSVEPAANHKFFNFSLIAGGMISAYVLAKAMNQLQQAKHFLIRALGYITITGYLLVLTLSGIIDFFVIANDTRGSVDDVGADEVATWIAQNTVPSAVFLNSKYIYHPASLAGRSIFLGWPYFPWSAGYEGNRTSLIRQFYESHDTVTMCQMMRENHLDYVTVEDTNGDPNLPTIDVKYFFTSFTHSFTNAQGTYLILSQNDLCASKP